MSSLDLRSLMETSMGFGNFSTVIYITYY
jgi:hypothetical protein